MLYIILLFFIIYIALGIYPIFINKQLPKITHAKITNNNLPIPKVIHRTWHDLNVNKKMIEKAHDPWVKLNPDFTIKWYDLEDCRQYMKSLDNRVYKAWEKLKPLAFKSDLWRLCKLYNEGGVYVDADSKPFYSINTMTKNRWNKGYNQFIAAHELEIKLIECTGVHNGFIISTPKHPFLKACIDKIIENVENERYFKCDTEYSGPYLLFEQLFNITGNKPKAGYNVNKNPELNYYLFKYAYEQIFDGYKRILKKKYDFFHSTFYKKIIKNNWSKMSRNKDIYH